ncbi:MAG: hypothetical protein U1F83_19395 [Verrucomicrobiota bacterium]
METFWRNRITGQSCSTPESLPFLGLWQSVQDGLIWPGTERDLERPDSGSEPSEMLCQSLRNLAARIEPLVGGNLREWANLVPLDPTITSDLDLRDYEQALIQALPHVETLSHNPRGHLTIEEIREEVGRARRVSHRAVATLAAHSEDWQTRTFLGVRPRRILAESRQDQWDIYENRAVATLRKRILGVLNPRLQKLHQILQALDEASEHSEAAQGTRFRRDRLFRLWGEAFASHPSRDRIDQLINQLEAARARLLALADTFLFKQMPHFAAVESPLHSTNVFQSDAHYRQSFHLWHKWERVASVKPPTPAERAANRRRAALDWNLFTVLLVIRACRQLGLFSTNNTNQPIAIGKRISLARQWTLVLQNDYSIILECHGKPRLQIVGIYTSWVSQSEQSVMAALRDFHGTQKDRYPILIISVEDPGSPSANWSPQLQNMFKRLRSAALLSDNLAMLEASPLKIDSTESVARFIHWVTAEVDWPKLPLRETLSGWSDVWHDLPRHHGIRVDGQNFHFFEPPSESLITEAKKLVTNYKRRWEQTCSDREKLRQEEQRARSNRRALGVVNLQKRAINEREQEAEVHYKTVSQIYERILNVRDRLQFLESCPCCQSNSVRKHDNATIMVCSDCDSEWGRRECKVCRRDYAFIVPHDPRTTVTTEEFDPVRIFGADMCAALLPPAEAPFLTRSTECPHCKLPVLDTQGVSASDLLQNGH